MTPEQCFAARVVLGWSREELAKRAGLRARGVGRFERGEDVAPWIRRRIEDALTGAGISFVENWGVTYREKLRHKTGGAKRRS